MSKLKKIYHLFQRYLAKIWLDINLQLKVVGITGSYGKTSTAYAISAVLSGNYSVNTTDINLDTNYNLPITLLKTKIWDQVLVLEYGIDHLGEMDKHLSLVKPKIAILTGITSVHTDEEHLKSLENVISEKRKLIEDLPSDGLAIFNYDDENVRKIGEEYNGRKFFYGTNDKADIYASEIKITTTKTSFRLIYSGENRMEDENDKEVETKLLGYPAVYSCLVAWIVGKELKVEKDRILMILKALKPLKGRFSIEQGPMGTVLVNDALRANFASTLSGLKSFAEFEGRKIAVLGEMGEIGGNEEKLHLDIGKELASLKLDILVGVGPLAKLMIEGAKKSGMKSNSLFWAKDVKEASKILKGLLKKDDLLYLKGSLLRHLERIILILNNNKIDCEKISCSRYSSCDTCSQRTL